VGLSDSRWHVITPSSFPWEQEALDWLRNNLPDRDPWHVWTNFEFIDDEGKISEVDALVLSPVGLFVVEIKSRPGLLTGDAHSWTWSGEGRTTTVDNPLILTNRKSKRLSSLLKRQPAIVKAKARLPFVEPIVFLSATQLTIRLEGNAKIGAFKRGRPGHLEDDGIAAALANGTIPGRTPWIDGGLARTIQKALKEAGVRPSNKHRTVGDYTLGHLLEDGEGFQDWHAQHVSLPNVFRRIRIYSVAKAASPAARETLVRHARREFEVLEGIDHPGILKVKDYKETENGPALIFDHEPKAVRMDHYRPEDWKQLNLTQRLQLIRDIAEILKHAHGKRLFHRSLGPQSILLQMQDNGLLNVRLMNWQTAARSAGESAAATRHHTMGTRHVEDYVDEPGRVYLAPETNTADPSQGASLDVFSLGALAFHIFSGQRPATNVLELTDKLRAGPGLLLSDVMDGCSQKQIELVQFATAPDLLLRFETVADFLGTLEEFEDEITSPTPEAVVDPAQAVANSRIEGGFTVVRRLGRGSSSDALLVQEDGSDEEFVLKVAIDPAHNERLTGEGEALARLHHQNIVAHRRTLSVAGRTALLLRSAGARTLGEELRQQGRLALDMLQRFGDELINAVAYLEREGVIHRDIKPDNIGIAESRSRSRQLVLFDFSLTRTPAENISAGTHPYLDPFLRQRKPVRWDLYAERFALAVTLYEMAVGQPPIWGDGRSAPEVLEDEVTIEREVFDPVMRDGFAQFFEKALKRDFRERFDNADDMLHAWRALFEQESARPIPEGGQPSLETLAPTVRPNTTMSELGYSRDAQDALERAGIHNTRQLLAMDRHRFLALRGVGDKVRKEIRALAKELARLRPDLTLSRQATGHDEADQLEAVVSINDMVEQLLPRRSASDDRPEEAAVSRYLGLVPGVASARSGLWCAIGEAAAGAGVDRAGASSALLRSRDRWLKQPALTEVREALATLLASQGKVMTAEEVALALLAMRGCADPDDSMRLRLALAVLRAAVEAEAALEQPRFQSYDHRPHALIATHPGWAEYARRLGAAADACAQADPLLSPPKAIETLERVVLPPEASEGEPGLPTARLLRLAASASQGAALSSRQEIYPKHMGTQQALRQSIGALLGARELQPHDIQSRVRGRYPEALPLPGRPELDQLLDAVEAPLRWSANARKGAGAYQPLSLGGQPTAGSTTQFSRRGTQVLGAGQQPDSPELSAARQVDQRLQHQLVTGGLLTLTVEPRLARHAQAELLRRFSPAGLTLLDVDQLLLSALRRKADELRINWGLVLRADASARNSVEWTRLQQLLQRALPELRSALLSSAKPLLLANLGLLARYDQLGLLTELGQSAGHPNHTPAAWLLLPTARSGLPTIDGVAVPLVGNLNNNHTLPLPVLWIENKHRTAA
jgi:serine/threonine protein kinase